MNDIIPVTLSSGPPMRHGDWSFDNLLPDDQNVVVKLLAVVPLDAQAIISESSVSALECLFVILMLLVFFL